MSLFPLPKKLNATDETQKVHINVLKMGDEKYFYSVNKTEATQNKFTEMYSKCVDIFIFSTKHSTQLTQRSSHNYIQNDLTQS